MKQCTRIGKLKTGFLSKILEFNITWKEKLGFFFWFTPFRSRAMGNSLSCCTALTASCCWPESSGNTPPHHPSNTPPTNRNYQWRSRCGYTVKVRPCHFLHSPSPRIWRRRLLYCFDTSLSHHLRLETASVWTCLWNTWKLSRNIPLWLHCSPVIVHACYSCHFFSHEHQWLSSCRYLKKSILFGLCLESLPWI